jgi:MFS family permease
VALIAGLAAAVVLAALPFAIEPWGYAGAFVLLGAFGLVWIPFLPWLPDAPPPTSGVGSARAPHRRRALMTLAAVLVLGLGEGSLWAFTERIGVHVGLSGEKIGAVLAGTTLIGLAGAGLAAWLGTRHGRGRPIAVGLGALVVATGGIGYVTSPAPYVAMLLAWGIVFFFTMPFLMGTTAALDPLGRWTAAASGASSVGTALGPAAAGVLVGSWSYPALSWLIVVCGIAVASLVLPTAFFVDRGRVEEPGT